MSANIPNELKYTTDHEWAKLDGSNAIIGITDFAQNALGDIVFVELPEVGTNLEKGSTFGVVESIKSVSDLYAPLSGEVVEVNSELEAAPELINSAAYDSWIVKIKLSNESETSELLSADDYKSVCEEES